MFEEEENKNVGWNASMYIWWGQVWRFIVVNALVVILVTVASKATPLVHKALFDLMTNYEGTTLLALFAAELYLHMWAMRQSFMDHYPTFTFAAESKTAKGSVLGFDRKLRWHDAVPVWWAQVWRMLLIPGAIVGGNLASTFASHPGAANYTSLLNSNLTKLNLYAAFVLSIWATKESLGDRYRTFRFTSKPKSLYNQTRR